MKMTIREALDYIEQANGKPYTEELHIKVEKFLHNLPRNPENDRYDEVTVKDYNNGWFAVVRFFKNMDGTMFIKRVDGDNMDENPNRVKTNEEALQVLKELDEIRFASDIDEHWNMSDDHRYWRRMNDLDNKAWNKREQLLKKLR